jgi:hypothetical protein
MSAVYSGRQGPSYEEEELSAMYHQAMNSLHAEDADPGGARTPVATQITPMIPRDSTQYDLAATGTPMHHLCLAYSISDSSSKILQPHTIDQTQALLNLVMLRSPRHDPGLCPSSLEPPDHLEMQFQYRLRRRMGM